MAVNVFAAARPALPKSAPRKAVAVKAVAKTNKARCRDCAGRRAP